MSRSFITGGFNVSKYGVVPEDAKVIKSPFDDQVCNRYDLLSMWERDFCDMRHRQRASKPNYVKDVIRMLATCVPDTLKCRLIVWDKVDCWDEMRSRFSLTFGAHGPDVFTKESLGALEDRLLKFDITVSFKGVQDRVKIAWKGFHVWIVPVKVVKGSLWLPSIGVVEMEDIRICPPLCIGGKIYHTSNGVVHQCRSDLMGKKYKWTKRSMGSWRANRSLLHSCKKGYVGEVFDSIRDVSEVLVQIPEPKNLKSRQQRKITGNTKTSDGFNVHDIINLLVESERWTKPEHACLFRFDNYQKFRRNVSSVLHSKSSQGEEEAISSENFDKAIAEEAKQTEVYPTFTIIT